MKLVKNQYKHSVYIAKYHIRFCPILMDLVTKADFIIVVNYENATVSLLLLAALSQSLSESSEALSRKTLKFLSFVYTYRDCICTFAAFFNNGGLFCEKA